MKPKIIELKDGIFEDTGGIFRVQFTISRKVKGKLQRERVYCWDSGFTGADVVVFAVVKVVVEMLVVVEVTISLVSFGFADEA